MILQNLNAKVVKEVYYSAALQTNATSVLLTVENCHVNCFIEQIVITFNSTDSTCGNILCSILDRGTGYTGSVNGYNPVTFANIGYSTSPTTLQNLVPNNANTQVTIFIYESVQDSDGLGNIYVSLTKSSGVFNVGFTMAVIYKPEITYNPKFNTRNQISNDKPYRVLSQVGILTYGDLGTTMSDQTNKIAHNYNSRNNLDISTFGFLVSSQNPYFYFGTPYQTKRWFLGFSSDCTPNIGVVTFSYFNGATFIGFAATQIAIGAQGPGTYKFAYDGVVVFTPPVSWSPQVMTNDPLTVYNTSVIGLGTLRSNNPVSNPGMYWIQCQVGFSTTLGGANTGITVSTIVPLIDPALPLTGRRRLI